MANSDDISGTRLIPRYFLDLLYCNISGVSNIDIKINQDKSSLTKTSYFFHTALHIGHIG